MNFGRLQSRAPAMRRLFEALAEIALTNANLLVEGETGVGKELVVEEVHRRSARAAAPLVTFDCAALSSEFAQRELLGAAAGEPTDEGSLAQAQGGTLVLDHVEALAVELQAALHDALKFQDVRVIALTTATLVHDVERGNFHRELYQRVAAHRLEIPPLRERMEDIPLLVEALLIEDGARLSPVDVPDELWEHFRRQCWRGNVRELKNALSRWYVMKRAVPRA